MCYVDTNRSGFKGKIGKSKTYFGIDKVHIL